MVGKGEIRGESWKLMEKGIAPASHWRGPGVVAGPSPIYDPHQRTATMAEVGAKEVIGPDGSRGSVERRSLPKIVVPPVAT